METWRSFNARYLNRAGKEHAAVDIFRFNDDGEILEHWDVLQPPRNCVE